MKIHTLSEEVINTIAAGEVVQSPVSVVKELIENSIDAGSTKITVSLNAGYAYISVADNGSGVQEIEKALLRHTTSKIEKAEDLLSLTTMGFRGEALSSIAAVSICTLQSAYDASGKASSFRFSAGVLQEKRMAARTKGTTVIVEDLFFNTPARKAFQKTAAYIRSQILRLIHAFSLAFPSIAWTLSIEGKTAFSHPSLAGYSVEDQLKKSARNVLGDLFVTTGKWISKEVAGLTMTGILGSSQMAKRTKLGQYLFVNLRMVRSPFLSSLVKELYKTRIGEKEQPSFVLHFSFDPHLIDVNIHPEKKEIRFQKESWIRKTIFSLFDPIKEENPTFSQPLSFQKQVFFQKEQAPHPEEPLLQMPLVEEPTPSIRYLSRAGSYILFERERQLWMMNGKEALFQHMLHGITQKNGERQTLIAPHVFSVSPEVQELEDYWMQLFLSLGIEMRFLNRAVSIDALPPFLRPEDAEELFLLFIEGKPEKERLYVERLTHGYLEKKLRLFAAKKTLGEGELKILLHTCKIEPPYCRQVTERDLKRLDQEACIAR